MPSFPTPYVAQIESSDLFKWSLRLTQFILSFLVSRLATTISELQISSLIFSTHHQSTRIFIPRCTCIDASSFVSHTFFIAIIRERQQHHTIQVTTHPARSYSAKIFSNLPSIAVSSHLHSTSITLWKLKTDNHCLSQCQSLIERATANMG
jgi:hypothetical protein